MSVLYLNQANNWPDVALTDLEIAPDGALQLAVAGDGFAQTGAFLAGPFTVGGRDTPWHRLRVMAEPIPSTLTLRLWTYTAIVPDTPAFPVSGDTSPVTPPVTPAGNWRAVPKNALDALILNEPAPYLWLAGALQGDGDATPRLRQISVTHDARSWLEDLPGLYRRDDNPTLRQMLDLFASLFDDKVALIDGMTALFDPHAAPDAPPDAAWLDWLAGWLAFDLEEAWDETKRRETLATIYSLYPRRGTVDALRDLLSLYVDAEVRIVEPVGSAIWSLGQSGALGFSAHLAPAYPQGAVVGNTAILDQSHLLDEDEIGAPLYEADAHHFVVEVVKTPALNDAQIAKLHTVIAREKPAHTTYSLRVIEAEMRAGAQARLGIDSIVGGGLPPTVMGESRLGIDSSLPKTDDDRGLGKDTRLGTGGTRLAGDAEQDDDAQPIET